MRFELSVLRVCCVCAACVLRVCCVYAACMLVWREVK